VIAQAPVKPERALTQDQGKPAEQRSQPGVEAKADPPVEIKPQPPAAPIPAPTPVTLQAEPPPDRAATLIAAGKQALARGDLVAARTQLSEALLVGVRESELPNVRGDLTRIGQETVFSGRIVDGDPYVTRYIVQPGDSLVKIAAANKVSVELLAQVNGIRDKNMIRAGQSLKVVKGPFHARVDKGAYTLDVYLDKTFVKSFPVGLGAEDSTPTGTWQVANKLVNPTYYPPRGGGIIAADDPKNPLGERWIGLTGISGSAVGQERYGVHGTIEPESIGKSVSLGCVRLKNEDVEVVYDYLVEKHSTVTIVE
jgi:lipoprotein-anchoring transpeptidase ErfK/SrfK